MQNRIVFPVAIASLAMGLAFGTLAILERNQVHRLSIATGSSQGQYFAFSQALAEVVSRHAPNLRIDPITTAGSVENMELLESRNVDLALTQNDTPATTSARAVAVLFPELLHIIAAPDSGIETLSDLRDRRIALMPEGSGSYALFWQLAEHYGLTPETLDHIALPSAEADAAFLSGEVDALSKVIALGNSNTAILLQQTQSSLISVEQVAALQITQPFLTSQTFPQGAYGGNPPIPRQDVPAVAVQAILMSHRDTNPQLIRELTRVLNEHRSELIALHPGSSSIPVPTFSNNFGVPVHSGAESYYKQDEPNFLITYAESIGLMVSVGVLVASGLWQIHQRLLQRQKNRADMYNLEILALLDRVCSVVKKYKNCRNENNETSETRPHKLISKVSSCDNVRRKIAPTHDNFPMSYGSNGYPPGKRERFERLGGNAV